MHLSKGSQLQIQSIDESNVAADIVAHFTAGNLQGQTGWDTNISDLRQRLDEGAFDVALVDFAPTGDPDLYDFWSQEAIINGNNVASWNNRKASESLEDGRQTWPTTDRRLAYNTFQRHYNQSLPALTIVQQVYTYALSPEVNQVEIGLITEPRDRYQTLAHWFLQYQDIAIDCVADE